MNNENENKKNHILYLKTKEINRKNILFIYIVCLFFYKYPPSVVEISDSQRPTDNWNVNIPTSIGDFQDSTKKYRWNGPFYHLARSIWSRLDDRCLNMFFSGIFQQRRLFQAWICQWMDT